MAGLVAFFISGLLFGLGLAVSQMVNPAKVLAFLDVAGDWDPSLAFVMAGALMVALPAFHFIFRREGPVLTPKFSLPLRHQIDPRLLLGAALFGIGWGLVGLCPGPAVASLAYFKDSTVIFLLALVAGMGLHRFFLAPRD